MTTRVVFNEEMRSLNKKVVRMGDLAKAMIEKGVQAFLEGDMDLRREVEELDHQIYLCDQGIEKHCVEIIALHQPVAGDLRTVTTCLKIITDLNRIGRYGRDIAELAGNNENGKRIKKVVAVPLMAELATGMVNDAIDSFVTRDDGKARGLFKRDDEVDSLWDTIFRGSLTHMMEDSRNISIGMHFILVARYLERIADHSCNIGDRVVFMVTGQRMNPYTKQQPVPRDGPSDHDLLPTEGYYSTHLSEK